jgi:hypothetical protein
VPVFTINLTQRVWDIVPDGRSLEPERQLLEREAGQEHEPDDGPSAEERWATEMAPLLAYIPAIEADMVELYYLRRVSEPSIAEIFGLSQAAISYRL